MLRNIRFKIGLLWKKENNMLWYNRDLAVKKKTDFIRNRFSQIQELKYMKHKLMNISIKVMLRNVKNVRNFKR